MGTQKNRLNVLTDKNEHTNNFTLFFFAALDLWWVIYMYEYCHYTEQGFFQQFWEKVSGQNWEKMIDLTTKLGEINDIEHNKSSKIYP